MNSNTLHTSNYQDTVLKVVRYPEHLADKERHDQAADFVEDSGHEERTDRVDVGRVERRHDRAKDEGWQADAL